MLPGEFAADDADSLSDDDLAADEFLADRGRAQRFKEALNKEELLDYLHMKCINEVNMPIDAIQKKHLRMIGAQHNAENAISADDGGLGGDEDEPGNDELEDNKCIDSDSDDDSGNEENFAEIARKSTGHEQRTAHFNKMMYLKSFGVRFELPTAHIIDAAVFAREPEYII